MDRANEIFAARGVSRDLREYIFDWNVQNDAFDSIEFPDSDSAAPELLDETLRDGLQSTSARVPDFGEKAALVRLMRAIGIDAVNLGYPAATPGMYEDSLGLARMIRDEALGIAPYCLGRTLIGDVEPMVKISDELETPVHAFLFIGSSPIRQFVEEWDVSVLVRRTREAISYAVSHGLTVMFFTEDTTRSHPDVLRALWEAAVEAGAARVGLADTVGHADPVGAARLVRYARSVLKQTGKKIKLDWHGHNDRGLSVASSLAALRAGANRAHGCALGIGERVGNTPMEQLLVNLKLSGHEGRDLRPLREYSTLVSKAWGISIPNDYPIVGQNAFRTSTGIHAAAVIKAQALGGRWLADRVYSAVPAEEIGLKQVIEVGPQSGKSNVQHWLATHGYSGSAADDFAVSAILEAVKRADRVLTEKELRELVASVSRLPRKPATERSVSWG